MLKNIQQLPIIDSFNDDNIKIFALGGLDEVGKNMYCIECEDELIVIDSGILFPDSGYGIDYVLPDYSYLVTNQSKIKALFITHGHEDHIGGIPHLLKEVKIPVVYASGLAVKLIEYKMRDYPQLTINLKSYNKDDKIPFKNFKISFFRTNHSIPDSFGIAIKTRLGYILHTGDFKFDFTPLAGHTEYAKITKYATEGVLCMLSDSTNAKVTKLSVSERKIGESIHGIFNSIKGRIIISTFASNVHRVQQIVKASVDCGRKVMVFGRSMEKIVSVARTIKYIDAPDDTFITAKDYQSYRPEQLTIITTGSQGETLAALSRIADGTHRVVKIAEGDTVIFSSSAIPGNQDDINRTVNKLYKAGAKVITNSPLTDTHTSGHASEVELQMMLALAKPKYFAPIHGEFSMQQRHIELAVETGVKKENCFLLENGQVLTFNENKVFSLYAVPSGANYIDSDERLVEGNIIKERRLLSEEGLITVVFLVNRQNKLVLGPTIISRGFIYMRGSEGLIKDIRSRAISAFYGYQRFNKKGEVAFTYYIINELTNFIHSKTERKPIIIPVVIHHETEGIYLTDAEKEVRKVWQQTKKLPERIRQ